jgi:hypothetical protein
MSPHLPVAPCHKIYYLAEQVLSCVIENSEPTWSAQLDYKPYSLHLSCTSHTDSSVAQGEMYLQEGMSDSSHIKIYAFMKKSEKIHLLMRRWPTCGWRGKGLSAYIQCHLTIQDKW